MSDANGWIGSSSQLLYALSVVGADMDKEGNYLIYGEPVISFLGLGEEMVVGEKTNFSIGGQRRGLAGFLQSTSYGMAVQVI